MTEIVLSQSSRNRFLDTAIIDREVDRSHPIGGIEIVRSAVDRIPDRHAIPGSTGFIDDLIIRAGVGRLENELPSRVRIRRITG